MSAGLSRPKKLRTHDLRSTNFKAGVTSNIAEVLPNIVTRKAELVVEKCRDEERQGRKDKVWAIHCRPPRTQAYGDPSKGSGL